MTKMFDSKNEKLFNVQAELKNVEPSTLSDFGQNVSDNLFILSNRISAIMSGSSDDAWDDKVKTQIQQAIDSIKTSAEEEKKSAEVVISSAGILTTLKLAVEDYALGYEAFEVNLNKKPSPMTEKYTDDEGVEHEKYTAKYSEWLKEDSVLRKTVPILEEQAETWQEQLKTFFEAYDFTKHETDTTIYKENKEPLKSYAELYDKYSEEYVEVPYEENVVAAAKSGEEVQETEEGKEKVAEEKDASEVVVHPDETADAVDPEDETVAAGKEEELPEGVRTETVKQTDDAGVTTTMIQYFENDLLIRATYTKTDKDNQQIEEGSFDYYSNGKVQTWKYDAERDENGSKVTGAIINYKEDGKTVTTATYKKIEYDNGTVCKGIKEEYYDDKNNNLHTRTTEERNDANGKWTGIREEYRENGTHKQTYITRHEKDGDVTEGRTFDYDDEGKNPVRIHTDKFTDKDGNYIKNETQYHDNNKDCDVIETEEEFSNSSGTKFNIRKETYGNDREIETIERKECKDGSIETNIKIAREKDTYYEEKETTGRNPKTGDENAKIQVRNEYKGGMDGEHLEYGTKEYYDRDGKLTNVSVDEKLSNGRARTDISIGSNGRAEKEETVYTSTEGEVTRTSVATYAYEGEDGKDFTKTITSGTPDKNPLNVVVTIENYKNGGINNSTTHFSREDGSHHIDHRYYTNGDKSTFVQEENITYPATEARPDGVSGTRVAEYRGGRKISETYEDGYGTKIEYQATYNDGRIDSETSTFRDSNGNLSSRSNTYTYDGDQLTGRTHTAEIDGKTTVYEYTMERDESGNITNVHMDAKDGEGNVTHSYDMSYEKYKEEATTMADPSATERKEMPQNAPRTKEATEKEEQVGAHELTHSSTQTDLEGKDETTVVASTTENSTGDLPVTPKEDDGQTETQTDINEQEQTNPTVETESSVEPPKDEEKGADQSATQTNLDEKDETTVAASTTENSTGDLPVTPKDEEKGADQSATQTNLDEKDETTVAASTTENSTGDVPVTPKEDNEQSTTQTDLKDPEQTSELEVPVWQGTGRENDPTVHPEVLSEPIPDYSDEDLPEADFPKWEGIGGKPDSPTGDETDAPSLPTNDSNEIVTKQDDGKTIPQLSLDVLDSEVGDTFYEDGSIHTTNDGNVYTEFGAGGVTLNQAIREEKYGTSTHKGVLKHYDGGVLSREEIEEDVGTISTGYGVVKEYYPNGVCSVQTTEKSVMGSSVSYDCVVKKDEQGRITYNGSSYDSITDGSKVTLEVFTNSFDDSNRCVDQRIVYTYSDGTQKITNVVHRYENGEHYGDVYSDSGEYLGYNIYSSLGITKEFIPAE